MKTTNIRVLVARTQEAFEKGCDDVVNFDTLKEARAFAKRALTPEYQAMIESSEPMNCTRVMGAEDNREVCFNEYWRKGWQPAPIVEAEL